VNPATAGCVEVLETVPAAVEVLDDSVVVDGAAVIVFAKVVFVKLVEIAVVPLMEAVEVTEASVIEAEPVVWMLATLVIGTATPLVQVVLSPVKSKPGLSPSQQVRPTNPLPDLPIRNPGQQTLLYSTPVQLLCAETNWRLVWRSRARTAVEKRMVDGRIGRERKTWGMGISPSFDTQKQA
jgi:hypothetical protein